MSAALRRALLAIALGAFVASVIATAGCGALVEGEFDGWKRRGAEHAPDAPDAGTSSCAEPPCASPGAPVRRCTIGALGEGKEAGAATDTEVLTCHDACALHGETCRAGCFEDAPEAAGYVTFDTLCEEPVAPLSSCDAPTMPSIVGAVWCCCGV